MKNSYLNTEKLKVFKEIEKNIYSPVKTPEYEEFENPFSRKNTIDPELQFRAHK
jgi:hypothetical protein